MTKFEIHRNDFNANIFREIFQESVLPVEISEKIKNLQPVLLNSYNRSYYRTLDKKFRATIDTEMEYNDVRSTWNFFPHIYREQLKTVVELKYDEIWNSEAEKITNQFPFRLDKNSKFVAGLKHFKNEIAE